MAQRLYDVLLLRGYGGRFPVSQRWREVVPARDWFPLFAAVVSLLAVLVLQWSGGAVHYPLAGPAVAVISSDWRPGIGAPAGWRATSGNQRSASAAGVGGRWPGRGW